MGNLPILKPREVVTLLEALGFTEVRQCGSHKQFCHSDGRCTTVPFHAGRDVSPILLRQIAKDVGLTVDELLNESLTRCTGDRALHLTLLHGASDASR
mgnify:CR=1 FL=1